jgi:cytochrome c-type biogenesis protein CcmH/NrfG
MKGTALARLDRIEPALEAHETAIRLDPRRAEAWLHMAETLGAAGRSKEAISAYRQALDLGPDPEMKALLEARLNRLVEAEGGRTG